ncbi:MAG: phospho-sugar mutase [Lachnospiraceae bacterium]|nr:phospho-sugar mutase [Lachnospiraceae bacterium]
MDDRNYYEKYNMWLESPVFDEKTKSELLSIKDNEEEIKERFYKDLEFGTGGLRGVIGAGCNRLNIYTVRKATQGLSDYIKEKAKESASAVIAFDSRRMSPEFALETAKVFAANGIKAYVFRSLRPTPELSFAVRRYGAAAGIVITASHNPPEYNGYKVYWSDGAQVSSPMDKEIITRVNSITDFSLIKVMDEKDALEKGLMEYIEGNIDDEYIENVLAQSRRITDNKALKVVYTPLNGTGNVPVNRALKEAGFSEVYNVEEQRYPDSEFTTIGYPNPEDKAVFKMGIALAKEKDADIVIATDPDADRIGVAVKEKDGSFSFLTGNMTAAVLCEYICAADKEAGTLPENGVVIKTVVSTPMTDAIAKGFGLGVINVLTGFKYIGAKIKEFEKTKANSFVFGFEESYGCLSGTYARDKDAISAALLMCEAAAYNKALGMTLTERLEKLYEEYGFFKEETVSITMKGLSGAEKIKGIMTFLRENSLKAIGGKVVEWECDYKKESFTNLITGESMPREVGSSDIIRYILEDESWVCVRPSGTEPKIKIYIGVKGTSAEDAEEKLESLKKNVMAMISNI